jgi:FtsP/CotA-like multicopper oxidase with cupredoxin domain
MSGRDAAGGGLITWASPFAAKKCPVSNLPGAGRATGHIKLKMVRIALMSNRNLWLGRRELLAGLSAAVLSPVMPGIAAAREQAALILRASPDDSAPLLGKPDALLWSPNGPGRPKRGDSLEFTLWNELPVPAVLNWHGLDGIPTAEPLAVRPPLAPGARENFQIPLRQAGTFLCDLRLLGDGQTRLSRALALIVGESQPVSVDRDEVLLIEDWRPRPDGAAMAPADDPRDASVVATINGQAALDITARSNERLRLRLINAFQRTVIAVKIEKFDVRVMALDSQPAEPFLARNSALLLAPGGRVDAFVDAAAPPGTTASILVHDGKKVHPIGRVVVSGDPPIRAAPLPPAAPLPSNGLPPQLDLKGALRFDLALGGNQANWVAPSSFATSAPAAFRAAAGRTVVLALTNRAETAMVFHLHGHHFRLLDRLDDGWKPFWLDTLAIESGQTQRVAFAGEYPGRWLIESVATDWTAPRLVRWYGIE